MSEFLFDHVDKLVRNPDRFNSPTLSFLTGIDLLDLQIGDEVFHVNHITPNRITGWQRSAADLPVRDDAVMPLISVLF